MVDRKLKRIVEADLPELKRLVRALWHCHRDMWMTTYRPFGWEVMEHRYGGLMARLDTLGQRLSAHLTGRLPAIPELEAKLHNCWPDITDPIDVHARMKTPSHKK
ncbi:MAG: hypothetical protein HRT89_16375 [Lentisphaeria bacterium]|nr:hypothetical protein [Lentisphaeria bacterium]NQZ69636.1 hypothetical protein [Lentisphaeria bacterium]